MPNPNCFDVTIRECGGQQSEWHRRVYASDEHEALAAAVKAQFGSAAGFWRDSGLPSQYGQIIEPASGGGSNCLTGRVRIDEEAV